MVLVFLFWLRIKVHACMEVCLKFMKGLLCILWLELCNEDKLWWGLNRVNCSKYIGFLGMDRGLLLFPGLIVFDYC